MPVEDDSLEPFPYSPDLVDAEALAHLGGLCLVLLQLLDEEPHPHAREVCAFLGDFLGETLAIYPYPIREYLADCLHLDPSAYPDLPLRAHYDLADPIDETPTDITLPMVELAAFNGLANDVLNDPARDTYLPEDLLPHLQRVNDYLTQLLGPAADPGEGFAEDADGEPIQP